MKYKVEQGVELPEVKIGKTMKYPFLEMGEDDSFFVKATKNDNVSDIRKRVASAASQAGRRHNMLFSVRIVDGGVRCWRVE